MNDNPDVQIAQARQLLRERRHGEAQRVLQALLAVDATRIDAWLLLAMSARMAQDGDAELRALQGALNANPYDLLALLVKGDCLDRLGRGDEAMRAYRAACTVADQTDLEALGADVQRMVRLARSSVQQTHGALADALDRLVEERGHALHGAARDRFVHAIDLMLGRRKRFDPQPMGLYYPQLPALEFYPRERFPWLAELEANTEAIRAEFLRVLAEDSGFEPYMQYDSDQPLAQWQELNRNPRWSAFHLIKDGRRVLVNAERCPQTMAALAPLPQPHQSGRTPVALFSCLQPQTRIPPHVGVSNVRLLVHLPLIVPPNCGFRVGSQTRQWVPGQALVFDDTIEHEAWNLSDELRVVLIFDIWHPDLSAEECTLLDALVRVQDQQAANLRSPSRD
jgi:aspartyl/asparaginyl beta-hydroxylase (cupin superfamily)